MFVKVKNGTNGHQAANGAAGTEEPSSEENGKKKHHKKKKSRHQERIVSNTRSFFKYMRVI